LNLGLQERTAIVGGASAGIGLAIAEALRREAANVVMFSNEPEELEGHARRIGGVAVAGDQRVQTDLKRLVRVAVDTFGGLDIVILNGGGPGDGPATEMDDDATRDGFDLLLLPVVRLTRVALPHLNASSQGRIVAVVSTSVLEPIDGLAQSNAFRPAVLGWLKTLAREVGRSGLTVNAVAPGRIATRTFEEFYRHRSPDEDLSAIPLGRFGDPRDVGDLVCFLASERAGYISGALIPIDGAMTRSMH
jgi:3-oxoacyl-[acyl-carrier protein] reductase